MKKVQKIKYNQNCKILRMAISTNSKIQKLLQKHPKTKNSKNIKKSCKEASNQKWSENKLKSELKNVKNDISENFKN